MAPLDLSRAQQKAAPARAARPRRQATPFQTVMANKFKGAFRALNRNYVEALRKAPPDEIPADVTALPPAAYATMDIHSDYMRQSEELSFRYGLRHGDRVFAFGSDEASQLGQPTHARMHEDDIEPTHGPLAVDGLNSLEVRQVAAGGIHSAAVTIKGVPYTWGASDSGIIGRSVDYAANKNDEDAVIVAAATPTAITGFLTVNGQVEDECISHVALGCSHITYLSCNGNVYANGFYRDVDSGGPYRDISTDADSPEGFNETPIHLANMPGKIHRIYSGPGANWNAAVTDDGSLITWGLGNSGQLARSANMRKPGKDGKYDLGSSWYSSEKDGEKVVDHNILRQHFLKPASVLFECGALASKMHVLSVACGSLHLLVVARPRDGSGKTLVYSAGQGGFGQLGYQVLEDNKEVHALRVIPTLTGKDIARVAAGLEHSLAMDRFGEAIYSWGGGGKGELGLGWPRGRDIQRWEPTPVLFPAGNFNGLRYRHVFKDICAGDSHSGAITINGELFTWGFGCMKATGHTTSENEDVWWAKQVDLRVPSNKPPKRVVRVMQVAMGGQHSVVLVNTPKASGN